MILILKLFFLFLVFGQGTIVALRSMRGLRVTRTSLFLFAVGDVGLAYFLFPDFFK